jgi:hypothetical protein
MAGEPATARGLIVAVAVGGMRPPEALSRGEDDFDGQVDGERRVWLDDFAFLLTERLTVERRRRIWHQTAQELPTGQAKYTIDH